MTTIAYRDGVLATDSQCTDNGLRCYRKKIWSIGGDIITVAGDLCPAMKFIEWYGGDKEMDKIDGDFECLVIKASGRMYTYDSNLVPLGARLLKGGYVAFGSGRDFAIGAMRMGADAKSAIRIACEYDCYSGGRVQFVHI